MVVPLTRSAPATVVGEKRSGRCTRAPATSAAKGEVERIGVRERKRDQHPVVGGEAEHRLPCEGGDPEQPALGEPHALGPSGGARGVEQKGGVVERQVIGGHGYGARLVAARRPDQIPDLRPEQGASAAAATSTHGSGSG